MPLPTARRNFSFAIFHQSGEHNFAALALIYANTSSAWSRLLHLLLLIREFLSKATQTLNKFFMELLSYANRNLAEYSKGIREHLLPIATALADPESYIPIAMFPEQHLNCYQEGSYYLLDSESFATPNRSICSEEYNNLICVPSGHIQTIAKSEYMPSEVSSSEHFHYQHVLESQNAKYLALQEMSYPNSEMQSPLLIRKDKSAQYSQDSQPQDSVYQDQHISLPEQAFQSTQCLQSLYPLESNTHSTMNTMEHYKALCGLHQYPDMTTMVNSNTNIAAPMVETTFIDHKVCNICGRRITRDMTRHMRTHQVIKRFVCDFPKGSCRHRSGQFNRRYDFKKHLLNNHFVFDDQNVKKVHNLKGKLDGWGTCHCGQRFLSSEWLDHHILTEDQADRCPLMYE